MYAHTPKERMESLYSLDGRAIQDFLESVRNAPVQVGTINYSQEERQEIIARVCKNTMKPEPAEFDKTAQLSNKDVVFLPVQSSGSYTMQIGQLIHDVSGADNTKLSKLLVANKIMSNSFRQADAQTLRTEKA